MRLRNKNKKYLAGFSLVELIVSLALFVTVAAAFYGASAISLKAISKAGQKTQAAFLLEEASEGVRSLRDLGWTKFIKQEQLGYEQCLYFDTSGAPPKNLFATSTPEIVSQWHLDDASGAASVIDTSGKSNNGTPTFSSPGQLGVTGKYQNAANFDGNDYINTILLASNLSLIPEVSLEVWIRPTSFTQDMTALGTQGGIGSVGGIGFFASTSGKPLVSFPISGCFVSTFNVVSPDPVSLNDWHHVVGTYNQGTLTSTLYVDGVLKKQQVVSGCGATPSISWAAASFKIGGQSTSQRLFRGDIDEVAIYNRALTADEVRDRYLGHAICPANFQYIDTSDGRKFKQTVTFYNTCRATNTPPPGFIQDDFLTISTAIVQNGACEYNVGGSYTGYTELNSKLARLKVIWGPNREFVESVDQILSNIFYN